MRGIHKHRGGIGCGTIIGIFALLSFLLSIAVLGGAGYFAYEIAKNPREFIKEHDGLVRKLGKSVVSVFNSHKPIVGEVPFDADAYNSFLQKQGELAQGFQTVQDEYTFELSATREEILSFLKQDLAAWGIQHFDMEFFNDRIKFYASVPGELITQRFPPHLPEVFQESLQSLDYLNVQGDMNFSYDNGIKNMEVHDFKLGSIQVADVFMKMFNQRMKGEVGNLEASFTRMMNKIHVKPSMVKLRDGEIFISGISTERPQ